MKVYFDTNILLNYCLWRYFKGGEINKDSKRLFERGLIGDYEIVISNLSLLELKNILYKKNVTIKKINTIINELKNSEEITYVNVDTMNMDFFEWIEKYVVFGLSTLDAMIIRVSQDCGCSFFVTTDKNLLQINNKLKENNVLDVGFNFIEPQELEKILPYTIESEINNYSQILENLVLDYFSKEGYSTATILDKYVHEPDIILEKDNMIIPIEFKFHSKRKITASEVKNALNNIDHKYPKFMLISSSGFTDEAIKIANKYESKIELKEIADIMREIPKKDYNEIKSIISSERIEEASSELLTELQNLWKIVTLAKTKHDKGKSLEDWASYMLNSIDGFKIINRNIRTDSEELDILISNNSPDIFWTKRSDPLLVECKNWKKKVKTSEIQSFITKLQRRKVFDGIFIAVNGITGNEYKDAVRVILDFRMLGYHVVVLQLDDIRDINNGTHPTDKIREKFYDLFK